MSDATLVDGALGRGVRLERELPASPSEVWKLLTDRQLLRSWFPCDVIVAGGEWTAGATLSFEFPTHVMDLTLSGVVLAASEPHSLSYRWGNEVLQFRVSELGTGTRLELINVLAPAHAARNAAGWDDCLDRLLGLEPAPDVWRTRFDAYVTLFTPTLGDQEGPPADYKG